MKCKITISYDNAEDSYICFGEVQYNKNCFNLAYDFDGDSCLLTYDGETLTQKRDGKMKTDMCFIAGKSTVCRTEDCEQGLQFSFETFTNVINYCKTAEGFTLKADYSIADAPVILNFEVKHG